MSRHGIHAKFVLMPSSWQRALNQRGEDRRKTQVQLSTAAFTPLLDLFTLA
jgi:hypothetical protein